MVRPAAGGDPRAPADASRRDRRAVRTALGGAGRPDRDPSLARSDASLEVARVLPPPRGASPLRRHDPPGTTAGSLSFPLTGFPTSRTIEASKDRRRTGMRKLALAV